MTELTIENRIASVDWHQYKGNEYFNPDDVAPALIKLVQLTDAQKTDEIYNNILFAIGNNHAGTYYSVIEVALPFIIETAIQIHNEISQLCALDILTDLYCAFHPEVFEYEHTNSHLLSNQVKQSIELTYDVLKNQMQSVMANDKNQQAISYLIQMIDE